MRDLEAESQEKRSGSLEVFWTLILSGSFDEELKLYLLEVPGCGPLLLDVPKPAADVL